MKFFIKLFVFVSLLGSLNSFAQTVSSGYLGVYLADVNEARARVLQLPEVRGAIVGKVLENSPAAAAGLRENDVILAFDNQVIQRAATIYWLLMETLPGSSVLLSIIRDGVEKDITVVMGDRQSDQNSALPESQSQFYARPQRLRLGLKVAALTEQLAEYLGTKNKIAVLITEVEARSLAERAGVKAGDCLLTINGTPIGSSTDLNRVLSQTTNKSQPNQSETEKKSLVITLQRGQKEQQIVMPLNELESDR